MRKLLISSFGLLAIDYGYGQDSTAAIYINQYIEKIEQRNQNLIFEKKDTIIYYEDSSRNMPLRIRTEFYTNPQSMQVEKIVEKSTYKKITTEIIVYFRLNQPVRLTTIQKEAEKIKTDFDVYFVNNSSVHFTKRTEGTGKPDGDELLSWCNHLLKDYNQMVESMKDSYLMPEPGSTNSKKGFSLFKKKKSG